MGKIFGTVFALDAGAIILLLLHDLTNGDRLMLVRDWLGPEATLVVVGFYLAAAFGSAFLSWLSFAIDALLVRSRAPTSPVPARRRPEPPLRNVRLDEVTGSRGLVRASASTPSG
ncbi:hypothetical protein JQC91_02730 [Jannaschia sp. Os4]|uniref:hypothetical protein n=1 Tax=Jannaschia sp. Os4 TaxID=2807617 RepID=UPI00193A6803|nr:hypothetical protein [Jannaschia sp. Os4]MBM2575210.1 hypothetical protein [Jannaschia sp. Os4]